MASPAEQNFVHENEVAEACDTKVDVPVVARFDASGEITDSIECRAPDHAVARGGDVVFDKQRTEAGRSGSRDRDHFTAGNGKAVASQLFTIVIGKLDTVHVDATADAVGCGRLWITLKCSHQRCGSMLFPQIVAVEQRDKFRTPVRGRQTTITGGNDTLVGIPYDPDAWIFSREIVRDL